MQQKNMREVLSNLIYTLCVNLDEITQKDERNEFTIGEVYAYLECLEIIQTWNKAEEYGLCGNLEEKYLAE